MEKDKVTRIKTELEGLIEMFKVLPENKFKMIMPLLENCAFMKITLEDLQASINENGCSEEYKNGENQFGKKAAADLQAYNQVIKNYDRISERLEKLLPEKTGGKLEALLKD